MSFISQYGICIYLDLCSKFFQFLDSLRFLTAKIPFNMCNDRSISLGDQLINVITDRDKTVIGWKLCQNISASKHRRPKLLIKMPDHLLIPVILAAKPQSNSNFFSIIAKFMVYPDHLFHGRLKHLRSVMRSRNDITYSLLIGIPYHCSGSLHIRCSIIHFRKNMTMNIYQHQNVSLLSKRKRPSRWLPPQRSAFNICL